MDILIGLYVLLYLAMLFFVFFIHEPAKKEVPFLEKFVMAFSLTNDMAFGWIKKLF